MALKSYRSYVARRYVANGELPEMRRCVPSYQPELDSWQARGSGSVVEHDNKPFSGRVRFIGMTRGRSAARFSVEAESDSFDGPIEFEMFMSDALALLSDPPPHERGGWYGEWDVVKRGANVGLRLVARS